MSKYNKMQATVQDLCNEVFYLGNIIACNIIDVHGRIKAQNHGDIPNDPALRSRIGEIGSAIWAGARQVEGIGGPLSMVSAIYQNFKILGIPIGGTNLAILITVPVEIDSYVTRQRVLEYIQYWLKDNEVFPSSSSKTD